MTRPFPPKDLNTRQPSLLTLTEGTLLNRFYTRAYDPVYFDRTTGGRLNAPDGAYGTFYASKTPHGAFAETFLRRPGRNLIDTKMRDAKAFVELQLNSSLSLIELTGPGLSILGATAEVTHGGLPYDLPQAWSQALHAHPCQADGIAYRSRHDDNELCYALFDRTSGKITPGKTKGDLDQNWFYELMNAYSVGLAP